MKAYAEPERLWKIKFRKHIVEATWAKSEYSYNIEGWNRSVSLISKLPVSVERNSLMFLRQRNWARDGRWLTCFISMVPGSMEWTRWQRSTPSRRA